MKNLLLFMSLIILALAMACASESQSEVAEHINAGPVTSSETLDFGGQDITNDGGPWHP